MCHQTNLCFITFNTHRACERVCANCGVASFPNLSHGCAFCSDSKLLLQFVVETRPTGQEREMTEGRTTEHLGTQEKVVQVTKPNPCGGVPTS